MSIIHVDFRFVDVLYELSATERYISSFEGQLPTLIKNEEEKVYVRIREEQLDINDGESELIRQELYDLTENVFPRFFRNAILVTVWSIFEAAITDIAKELQLKQHKTLGIDDLKGDLLKRTKKYFHHVVNFSLNVTGKEWPRITMLRVLRNAIAHCNGRIEDITKDKDLEDIQKWEKEEIGLTIEGGTLMFSKDFVEETYHSVNDFLTCLIAEVKKTYPNHT